MTPPATAKRPLTLAHASDIHLDTDYYGGDRNLSGRDYYRGVFAHLLQRIASLEPDLFLLPGDLFDHNRATDDTVRWCMEQLAALPCPILMIPGNHDCLEGDAVFLRHDFNRLPNLTLLLEEGGTEVDLPGLGVRAWGRAMVEHAPEFQPLAGLPAPDPARWNLALGHGIYVGSDGNSFRSSPIAAEDIAASGYDYVALGHHHALLDASAGETAAWYSGAPVPLVREKPGTFLSIDLVPGAPVAVRVLPLDDAPPPHHFESAGTGALRDA